jgi:RHS repeat-associated protein
MFEYGERHDGVDLFYVKDHLGSLTELVDSTQAVRARNRYDPFGRQNHTGETASRIGFSGHVYSATADVNLTYFRAYDPNIGRWLSSDPLGWKGGRTVIPTSKADPRP